MGRCLVYVTTGRAPLAAGVQLAVVQEPEHLQLVLPGDRAEQRAAQRQKGPVKPSLLSYGPPAAL